MKKKTRVAIIFGGKSAEHEVSLQSAQNIIEAMDREKYDIIPIGIDKKGRWHLNEMSEFLLRAGDPRSITLNETRQNLTLIPGSRDRQLVSLPDHRSVGSVDVVFPVLHGPFGEDGTIQGLLKLAGVPFVGASVLGSAVGMDKDVMKRLMRDAGIPTAKFLVFCPSSPGNIDFEAAQNRLGLPFFVKPANLGSSVGISKVKDRRGFDLAVQEAVKYDSKILVEEYVEGREIECSVLGNDNPVASVPGEVIPSHEFYSYEAKYMDETGAVLRIPAELPDTTVEEIQTLATKTFRVLCCEGMARVDFFLKDNQEILVNELNTIPGFTRISMYPKLWEATGISYGELIDTLIQLAMERFDREKKLKTSLQL
ncbi:MAG: D-alanine--D-alanine ligase [Fidelibacterota bacterium]